MLWRSTLINSVSRILSKKSVEPGSAPVSKGVAETAIPLVTVRKAWQRGGKWLWSDDDVQTRQDKIFQARNQLEVFSRSLGDLKRKTERLEKIANKWKQRSAGESK